MADTPRPTTDLLAELGPLRGVIAEKLATVPVHLGPGGTDQLADELTLAIALYVGRHVLPTSTLAPRTCERCQPLTPDNLKIIAGLARGHRAARIATDLNLPSAQTVHQRITTACTRIGLPRRSQHLLVHYAYQHGYMDGLTPQPIQLTGRLTPLRHETLIALASGATMPHHRREQLLRHLGAKSGAHAVALGWQLGLLGPGSGAAP